MSAPLALAALLLAAPAAAQVSAPPAAPVRTLKEAYRAALENSDSVAQSEQTLRQAEALYRAAFGGSFPRLEARHDTTWQDKRSGGDSTQSDGYLRVSQSGLTGYRELASVRSSGSVLAQRQAERRRAEQLLLEDVAGAYYGLIQAEENVSATAQLIEYADKRLAELKERVRVGRAREADALSQEVQSESLRSQQEESMRQVQARRDLLAYLTRAPIEPLAPPADAAVPPAPLEGYLSRLESRPDVAAARDAVRAAGGSLDVARAGYFPEFSGSFDYYVYRPAARSGNKWDAAASVSLPLFSFGATKASVEAARAGYSRQEYALRAVVRAAELELRNAHRDHASAVRQLDISRRSGALAQRDYRLQASDERRGLVTAIEVLQSLDRLNIANLALNNALVSTRLAAVTLELAAGAMPEDVLK
jgi:outer membrane protein TolC